jgi:peptide deformylase
MKLTRRTLTHRAKDMDFRYPVKNQILAEKILALMDQSHGIGLSATQIGLTQRIFVMRVHGRERICVNPEIIDSSDVFTEYDEGCLSFPGDQCTIVRPDWVNVRYQSPQGEVINDCLVGLEARCFQHELDHLNGITMWDRHKEQNAKQS